MNSSICDFIFFCKWYPALLRGVEKGLHIQNAHLHRICHPLKGEEVWPKHDRSYKFSKIWYNVGEKEREAWKHRFCVITFTYDSWAWGSKNATKVLTRFIHVPQILPFNTVSNPNTNCLLKGKSRIKLNSTRFSANFWVPYITCNT